MSQAQAWEHLTWVLYEYDARTFGRLTQPTTPDTVKPMTVYAFEVAEDIAIGERIRERDANDSGRRTALGAVAADFGIDLDSL